MCDQMGFKCPVRKIIGAEFQGWFIENPRCGRSILRPAPVQSDVQACIVVGGFPLPHIRMAPGEYIGGGKSMFLQIACYF
jgi:hypothetical protein